LAVKVIGSGMWIGNFDLNERDGWEYEWFLIVGEMAYSDLSKKGEEHWIRVAYEEGSLHPLAP
jgi:hypothetical protein